MCKMIGVVACLVVLKFNKQVISFGPGHHTNHLLDYIILICLIYLHVIGYLIFIDCAIKYNFLFSLISCFL